MATATAAKTAAPSPVHPATPATAAELQSLRKAQPKKFGPSALNPIGKDFELLCVEIPADWEPDDVLNPVAWCHVASLVAKDDLSTRKDFIGSLIYARSSKFKMLLTIEGVTRDDLKQPNGLIVQPWLK